MENLQIYQISWFIILGILFVGYSLLDGFDLGIGCLLPFISKNDKDTDDIILIIAPVWDGNEVWLVAAGASLFAAYPFVYATVFSGFYLAMMLILFSLIFRAVSIEFIYLNDPLKRVWKWAAFAGSLIPAVVFGVAVGNLLQGIELNQNMDYTGGFPGLFSPFTLCTGLLGFCMFLIQGSTYALHRTKGIINERLKSLSGKIFPVFVFFLLLEFIMSSVYLNDIFRNPLTWISTILLLCAIVLHKYYFSRENYFKSFIMSSVQIACLWGIVGTILFPNMVVSVSGVRNLTVYNSSSGEKTLEIMLAIALIGIPIVIFYSLFVYRIFRRDAGADR